MIYINVVCDGNCVQALPLYFDSPDETWNLMCGYIKHRGWRVVEFKSRKKLDQKTMKTYCPECRKPMDEIEKLEDFETEHGIRVPVRVRAAAAGIDLDQALTETEETS